MISLNMLKKKVLYYKIHNFKITLKYKRQRRKNLYCKKKIIIKLIEINIRIIIIKNHHFKFHQIQKINVKKKLQIDLKK